MRTLALSLLVVANFGLAYSQTAPATPEKPAEAKKDEPKPDPKVVEYDKAIKDLPKTSGPVTLYLRKKEILMEVKESQLDKLFCLQGAWNTGFSTSFQQGLPLSSPSYSDTYGTIDIFKLQKQSEDRVWLVRPQTKHRWTPGNPFADSISKSFPQAFLADFRIEQTNPEKKLLLLNVTTLFAGDLFNLNKLLNQGSGLQMSPDREKTRIDKVTGTADNLVVRMDHYYNAQEAPSANPFLALMGGGGADNHLEDSRSVNFKITYNLYFRPESDYKPRLADPRVGYFTNDYFSFDRYFKEDRTVRYINRWNLKKKDPKAAMSEPVKPIVWVVDWSVPKQYREATKRGLLEWNKAFEKLGYKNAVQVIDPPTDGSYDHADGRQNVVRWTVTNSADGAIALFRTDPLTGEILNASINVDGTFAWQTHIQYDDAVIPSAAASAKLFRQSISEAVPGQSEQAEYDILHPATSQVAFGAAQSFRKAGWSQLGCDYGSSRLSRITNDLAMLEANQIPSVNRQEMIEDYIADVVAHEAGHCMGLRHNFIASTNLTCAELGDADLVKSQGTAASVMDYIDLNIIAVLKKKGVFVNSTIGAYDVHAIRYGYADIPAATPEGELFGLNQIAKEGGRRGLEFMTDEDADGFDPRVVRFDGARDPINYAAATIQVAKNTMNYAIRELPKPGESYARRNGLILNSVAMIFGQANRCARFIGGLNASRTFKGDVGERPNLAPVDPNLQRQALQTIVSSTLVKNAFVVPDSVLNSLANDFNQGNGAGSAPVRSLLAGMQQRTLAMLMNATRISRIMENEFRQESNKSRYTVAEHYDAITQAVMKEIFTGESVSTLRRDLQRNLVVALLDHSGNVAGAVRDDAKVVAMSKLLEVRKALASYAKRTSGMNQLHATAMLDSIERFLNRQKVEGDFGGGGGGFDLASLLGGKTP